MSRKSTYKRYDSAVKAAISMTGRPDLFPEMDIPRMTALYWIRKGLELDDPVLAPLTHAINDAKATSDSLQIRVRELEGIKGLLHYVFGVVGFQMAWKHINDAETKSKILDAIEIAMTVVPRETCLRELNLSLSRYKRWRRERRDCGLAGIKSCPRGNANQLTFTEVQTMKCLVTSQRFAHYPIRSLHFFAKREEILFCSYSTWRKYINQFGWQRPRKKRHEKKRKVGIRAKHPNEIWHLDVSHFILPNKTKCYIQAITDNYSRYVIAWQVLESYDGAKTAALLRKALTKATADRDLKLIVDGGGQNRSSEVKKLEGRGHFKKQVAHFEISFSNSIVEAVFRSLKHNYLFHHEIQTLAKLKRHVAFWFEEHNEKIPHTSFNGETPAERYNQSWNKERQIRILVRHEEAQQLRIRENQKIYCARCKIA